MERLKKQIIDEQNGISYLDGVLWGVQRRLALKRRKEMLAEIERLEKQSKR
jgi:hypothetical protein